MKRGFAFEGGGAKGAYHIGVAKAFFEKGYEFDGFVGTSIGAVNAAVLAQGDFDKALELWQNISPDDIFTDEDKPLLQFADLKDIELNADFISEVKVALSKVIGSKGISTEKMLAFLNRYIDEDKLRASGKDFGLVTVSLTERKPYQLMLKDIPQGKLVAYIMASASLPVFSAVTIDGKKFLDGAFYNNCPVNLLDSQGYDEIIAVRVGSRGFVFSNIDKMKNVKLISAKEDLGSMMLFSAEVSTENIKYGYFDARRFIEKLRGFDYYITPIDTELFDAKLMNLDHLVLSELGKILKISNTFGKRMLFEKAIPMLGSHIGLHKGFDYADFIIALLERKATQMQIERLKIYEYDELRSLTKVHDSKQAKKPKKLLTNPLTLKNDTAIELLMRHLL